MLTRKQYDLLIFIHQKLQETGVSPSFDEMKEALDLKSKSGIHRLITALEERGFIRFSVHWLHISAGTAGAPGMAPPLLGVEIVGEGGPQDRRQQRRGRCTESAAPSAARLPAPPPHAPSRLSSPVWWQANGEEGQCKRLRCAWREQRR